MRGLVLSIVLLVVSPAFGQQPKEITNSIGMKLVLIPAGTFTMSSPIGEKDKRFGETPHEVTISMSYYIGAYEVTQDHFEKVKGINPSEFKGAKNPVDNVSWNDAVSFCEKLSEMSEEKAAGREYRLPTEAEWEYACRAGSKTTYCFGDSAGQLKDFAWFNEISERETHPVGEKKANGWGLFDMHGNVWEWCQDVYEPFSSDAVIDPQGPSGGSNRVRRGGSWNSDAGLCRSALRTWVVPSKSSNVFGFRIALSASVK